MINNISIIYDHESQVILLWSMKFRRKIKLKQLQ